MEHLLAGLAAPLSMLCICRKSVRTRWQRALCCCKWCPLHVDKRKFKRDHDLESGKLKTTKMTDQAEDFHQIGHVPSHWASRIFMDLLNESYTYLIVFITVAVFFLVIMFWIPFIVIVSTHTCRTITAMQDASSNATSAMIPGCVPPIENAVTIWDTFAVAFASLFSVPTRYTPNSATVVTLVTIEFAVGKLAVAGLTALLVIKVSRVPNNIVLSKLILVSKPRNHWTLTLRVGMLHNQTMSGCNVRLIVVKKEPVSGAYRDFNCVFDSSKHSSGFLALSQEPIDFRHVVDQNSPLWDVDMDKGGIRALKKVVLAFIVSIHGFDDTTGRSLGIERRYTFDRFNRNGGFVLLKERGYLADVVYRLSAAQAKRTGAKHSLALQWPNFNMVKERSRGKRRSLCQSSARNVELSKSTRDVSEEALSMSPDALAKSIITLQRELTSSDSESSSQNVGKLVRGSTLMMLREESKGDMESTTRRVSSQGEEDQSLKLQRKRSIHADGVHSRWAREHPDLARKKFDSLNSRKNTLLHQEGGSQASRYVVDDPGGAAPTTEDDAPLAAGAHSSPQHEDMGGQGERS